MPPRNLGNRNPGIERLGDDPSLLLRRPAPAPTYPGANVHPPARELRVAYSVGHMCETFPPNQREACDIPRASIKVGAGNRFPPITSATVFIANRPSAAPAAPAAVFLTPRRVPSPPRGSLIPTA